MELKECEWVGSEVGHHAAYTFYKGFKYLQAGQKWKVVGIGQFLFVRIWGETDLISVAEVQLLWEDKSTDQKMCSVRLYFLPEFTSDGRLPHHGEDELVAVAEKAVLRVHDLLDWVVPKRSLNWERGAKSIATGDCASDVIEQNNDKSKTIDLSEVDQAREETGDNDINEKRIVILSASNYCRYRALLKRLEGVESEWMKNNLIVALGGITTSTRNTSIMFAKELFDYPELEEHPLLQNHLAPKLKGRPRKKTGRSEDLSPTTDSDIIIQNCDKVSNGRDSWRASKRQMIQILTESNSSEERQFLNKLTRFYDEKGTVIDKPPMLGYKQIDLHELFLLVESQGGYDGCIAARCWKQVYDELGAAPNNPSAERSVRRLYERYLLGYERHAGISTNKKIEEVSSDSDDGIERIELDSDDKVEITLDESSGLQPKHLRNHEQDDILEIKENSDNSGQNSKHDNLARHHNDKSRSNSIESKPVPKPDKEPKQYLGLKSLHLLTEPKEESRSNSNANSQQIDLTNLILPPMAASNLEQSLASSLEQSLASNLEQSPGSQPSGSALQNLAKIASRYSKDKSRTQEFVSPGSKRPRLIDSPSPGVVQPLPATPSPTSGNMAMAAAALAMAGGGSSGTSDGMAGITASALLQQFSLMSPLLSASLSNSSSSATSQEGYNLLKYYEQQLKLLQGATATSSTTTTSAVKTQSSAASTNKKDPNSTSKDAPNKIAKEKNKVGKHPPDTARPPKLLQNPCQFLQTSTIYGSPKSDLDKVKENALKAAASLTANLAGAGASPSTLPITPNQVLDLSSGGSMDFRTVSPHHRSSLSDLSLSQHQSTMSQHYSKGPYTASDAAHRGSSSSATCTPTSQDNGIDLRITPTSDLRMRTTSLSSSSPSLGAKNFSAEALIGNNSSSKIGLRDSGGSAVIKGSSGTSTPVSSAVSGWLPGGASIVTSSAARNSLTASSLPAVTLSSAAASPSSSLTSALAAAAAASSPQSAYSAAMLQQQLSSTSGAAAAAAAASNAAYLQQLQMMMNPKSGGGSSSNSTAAAMAAASGSSASRMDPVSQYYAMLYSQQLAAAAAYSPYAAASGRMDLTGIPQTSRSSSSLGQYSSSAGSSSPMSFPGLFGSTGMNTSNSSSSDLLSALAAAGAGSQNAAAYAALSAGGSSQSAAALAALSAGGSNQSAAALAALTGGGSSQSAAALAAFTGGGSSQSAAALAALTGSGSSQSAAALAALTGGGNSQSAAALAALTGGTSSQSAAALAALTGGGSSQSAAALAALTGGGSSQSAAALSASLGLHSASQHSSLSGGSSGGAASGGSSAELQMMQAYQELLARSGAMPSSSSASTMFNISGLMGTSPYLSKRKE